jgi:hypothetical protein
MRFKLSLILLLSLSLLGFSPRAFAKVPYSDLDTLRKKTVVVRSALDNPEQAWVKKCGTVTQRASAGERLALATDNAAAKWKKLTLTAADFKDISKKVDACEVRGSCSVYEVYLGAVQIPPALGEQAVGLRSKLEKKLEAMTPSSYQKALSEIKQPCALLKSMTKHK